MNDLQEKIDLQREACFNADLEVKRCEQALENANRLCQIKHDALGELLNLQDLAKQPIARSPEQILEDCAEDVAAGRMTEKEAIALSMRTGSNLAKQPFPHGRYATIEKGGV